MNFYMLFRSMRHLARLIQRITDHYNDFDPSIKVRKAFRLLLAAIIVAIVADSLLAMVVYLSFSQWAGDDPNRGAMMDVMYLGVLPLALVASLVTGWMGTYFYCRAIHLKRYEYRYWLMFFYLGMVLGLAPIPLIWLTAASVDRRRHYSGVEQPTC